MYYYLISAFMFLVFIILFINFLRAKQNQSKNLRGFLAVIVLLFLSAVALLVIGASRNVEDQKQIHSYSQLETQLTAAPMLTPNTTSTPSITVIPEPTVTSVFGLGEPYTTIFQNILSNWQWYSYSTTPPLEKDDNYWPLNTDRVELYPESLCLIYRNDNETFPQGSICSGIGNLYRARLFSFPDNMLIQQIPADNASIVFDNIPAGDYYYSITCDGYQTRYSSVLRFEGAGEDVLVWSVPLLTIEKQTYIDPFSIQIVDQNQSPIENREFYLSIASETGFGYSSYPFMTDENGVFCLRSWYDGVEKLSVSLFSVIDGLSISLSDENSNNLISFLPVGNQTNRIVITQ